VDKAKCGTGENYAGIYVWSDYVCLSVIFTNKFQQEEELCQHTQQSTNLADKVTLSYLEACSKLFEHGLLSHDRITTVDDKALKNIRDGFKFFEKWLDEIYEQGMPLCM
jgi:hypothetical protein